MRALAVMACLGFALGAQANGVDALRAFARDVQSARAAFTQTVVSPDGARKKQSSGRFEFARPNRFRFSYDKPYEQHIVADGQKVWLYDVDLNQVTVRAMSNAVGATPAALLAGAALDKEFELSPQPARDGLEWAQAIPRNQEGTIRAIRIGFKGASLAALEIVDSFGQRSMLRFTSVEPNVRVAEDRFQFVPPKGADVIEQ
jgi:outer membrane lipoprotein carrier protein